MSILEQEIIERLHPMNVDEQRQVLDFIESLQEKLNHSYSASELMHLPQA